MNQQKELAAILGGILGYTPRVPEMQQALARATDDGTLPRSTYYEWLESGADRSVESILRVAQFYAGTPDKDGNPIDPAILRATLEDEFGYGLGSAPGFIQTATRKEARRKKRDQRPIPDVSDLG